MVGAMLGVARHRPYNRYVLRALEKMVGLEYAGHPARFWLAPAAVFAVTLGGFILIGEITAAPLYVSIPNGVVIALVMAGLTVACMIPAGADSPPDDDRPGGDDDGPVLGAPGGPWTVVAHLGSRTPDGAGREPPVPALSRSGAADRR
jgi:hypothetical protein